MIKCAEFESLDDVRVSALESICEFFSREIIQYGLHFLLNSVRMLLYQTYTSITFLMIYATMWYLNIHFDPHFYAIASYLLTYMRMTIVEFFSFAVKNLVQYLSAQQRIKVRSHLDSILPNSRRLAEISTAGRNGQVQTIIIQTQDECPIAQSRRSNNIAHPSMQFEKCAMGTGRPIVPYGTVGHSH